MFRNPIARTTRTTRTPGASDAGASAASASAASTPTSARTRARAAFRGAVVCTAGLALVLSCTGCNLFGGTKTEDRTADSGAYVEAPMAVGRDVTYEVPAAVMGLYSSTANVGAETESIAEPIPWNTEEYSVIDEHGFTSVAAMPFSTFSADVDTASYCNLRRMIRQGWSLEEIPDGAVRIEEMVNYFHYAYAAPQDGEVFGMTASIAPCPWNPDTMLLVMGLQTPTAEYVESAGNNLVFLIDVSGSMSSSNKLPLLKKSFRYLLDQLSPDDTISIVTYSGTEAVVLDGVPASERDTILDAIDSLRASGSTNGQAGLAMAYEVARSHFIEGGVNRIILASDGDLNVGITSSSDLSEFVTEQRDSGIYLSVLGFGDGNYKDTKMETIADDGNGSYYYIDCIEEARRVFGEDLCATMIPVADDVKLQIEFNPAYIKGYRQVGYENRSLDPDDFLDDSVDAGEVGMGHSVTVIYEIVPVDSALALTTSASRYGNGESAGVENGEWLALSVRYKTPAQKTVVERVYPVTEDAITEEPSEDWRFAATVAEFGMLASDSEFLGTVTGPQILEQLDALDLSDERRAEFRDLVEEALKLGGLI